MIFFFFLYYYQVLLCSRMTLHPPNVAGPTEHWLELFGKGREILKLYTAPPMVQSFNRSWNKVSGFKLSFTHVRTSQNALTSQNCPHFAKHTHTQTHIEVWATKPLSLHGCLLWKQHRSSLPPPPSRLLPLLWTPAWHTRPCSLAHIFTRRY